MNYLNSKKYQLNCVNGEKCWLNEGMSSLKSEFESSLIFPIRWSSFNLNYWNCFSCEKYQLNCTSGEKYWLNYRGGENADQIEECLPQNKILSWF